ncbi:hypothetical protein JCM11641_000630 [Rhodosporidiobolus odoratus]
MTFPDPNHRIQSKLLLGCYAFVKLDGLDTEVLGGDRVETKTYGYIESKDGAVIDVSFRDQRTTPPEDDFVLRLFVDGQLVNATAFQTSDPLFHLPPKHASRVTVWKGQLAGDRAVHRLRLEKANLTQEKTEAATQEQEGQIGIIRVCYYRIKSVRYVEPEWPARLADQFFLEDKPEASEGTPRYSEPRPTHQARLADEIEQPLRAWLAFDWIDGEDKPYCIFEWRYRSRAFLQQITFIPPDPSSLETPTPPASVTASATAGERQAHVARLLAELAGLQAEQAQLQGAYKGEQPEDIVDDCAKNVAENEGVEDGEAGQRSKEGESGSQVLVLDPAPDEAES